MIIVAGPARLKPGALQSHAAAMRRAIEATRREAGCAYYAYGEDVTQQDVIVALEFWRDEAALTAHFQTPHMREWIPLLKEIIIDHDVRVIDGGASRKLPL